MTTTATMTTTERRYDLDWLRIGAFGLLILYHIGMVFVPWDFHIKAAHPARWIEAPMLLLNAWRLPLLFLISGAASRFLVARRADGFAASRSARLLWPLLFGVAVVVPPQAWVDVTLNHGYARDYMTFWLRDYWRFDKGLGVVLPTYNHLWFVAYLWLYTMAMAAVAAVLPVGGGAALQRGFDRVFGGARLIVLPVLVFASARLLLGDRFPENHALIGDWYAHTIYVFAFAMGVGLAGSRTAWPTIARVWRGAAVAALLAWVVVAWVDLSFADNAAVGSWGLAAVRSVRAVQAWGAILALLGLAGRYWNRDHPWRVTLNEAVFPAYIAHQTILIVAMFAMRPLGLPQGVEFAVLVIATASGCALFYLAAREIGWLRRFAGLRPRALRPSVHPRSHPRASRADVGGVR